LFYSVNIFGYYTSDHYAINTQILDMYQ